MSDSVTLSRTGDVAVITIDDGKANALSFDLLDGINQALDASADAKAVTLVGRPAKFSAGFDLSIMTGDVQDARRLLSTGAELGLRLFTFGVPVVLGVTGHALAMGGILTTCADYRVGASGPFKIGLNEVAIGMPVPGFAVELCRNRLTTTWFTRCIQLAHICSPDEAVAAGFLDETVDPDAVADRAIEVASELAQRIHPGPFRLTRHAIADELAGQLRTGLAADMALFDVGS